MAVGMRTNIDIDEQLLAKAMKVGGFKTKRAAVEEALRLLARKKAYREVLALRGKVHWEGDPIAMRRAKGR
jgi:Arc/MetJ family transcription regulator